MPKCALAFCIAGQIVGVDYYFDRVIPYVNDALVIKINVTLTKYSPRGYEDIIITPQRGSIYKRCKIVIYSNRDKKFNIPTYASPVYGNVDNLEWVRIKFTQQIADNVREISTKRREKIKVPIATKHG